MSKRFGILITVMLAFAVAPAVAFAGDSTDDAAKKAERDKVVKLVPRKPSG